MSVKGEDLKQERVEQLLETTGTRFVRFKGAPLISTEGTNGLVHLTNERFIPLVYRQFGMGISKNGIAELRHAVENVAPDWTQYERYICFGGRVWDAEKLDWDDNQLNFVYESPIAPNDNPADIEAVRDYLLDLAAGDEELAHDYLQAMAPLAMMKKPIGIIWLIGQGANGKSAFLDAWYDILGNHFAEQSLDMIEDGRSTPALQGIIGNVVREASEKRIEDDKHYKNIGAHETFPIRILGTHETVTVDASFHSVINANNPPVFEDKSNGATRRTLLVPFPAVFADDPGFKERTFTRNFLGALLHLTLMETREVRDQGYHWSKATKALQAQYAANANTAEAFARFLDDIGLVGFKNYAMLRMNYDLWCSDRGMIALGRTQLVRAVENILKASVRTYIDDEKTVRRYLIAEWPTDQVVWLENGYGMAKKQKQEQQILGGEW